MAYREIEEVRVFYGSDTPNHPAYINQDRTAAQKHTDTGLDAADTSALEATVAYGLSLEWAASVGVEIPKWARDVETRLRQWQTHLADERKRRG